MNAGGGILMSGQPIQGAGDGLIEKRLKKDALNDLILELSRDGFDDNSLIELVKGLRRKYPQNEAILKQSEALGWEPEQKRDENALTMIDMLFLDARKGKELFGRRIADLVYILLSFAAQERESIRRRQTEGIAAAKARGVSFGRPRKKLPKDFGNLVGQWERRELPLSRLLEQTDMKHTTFFARLQEYRASKKKKKL